jgi:catechol 2,3-dioxygenase-like lactoylglutathione lyase family enzyme
MNMNALDLPASAAATATIPARLHHAAYVSADQERTRHFYEDVLGFPLTAFWIERDEIGGVVHEYSHAFYGMADGSALAFFNFSDPELQQRYTAKKQELFVHLALKTDRDQQALLMRRLAAAGFQAMVLEHGYARSLYVEDPDGQTIEFCTDVDDIESVNAYQLPIAHAELERWQRGDRVTNNYLRPAD